MVSLLGPRGLDGPEVEGAAANAGRGSSERPTAETVRDVATRTAPSHSCCNNGIKMLRYIRSIPSTESFTCRTKTPATLYAIISPPPVVRLCLLKEFRSFIVPILFLTLTATSAISYVSDAIFLRLSTDPSRHRKTMRRLKRAAPPFLNIPKVWATRRVA